MNFRTIITAVFVLLTAATTFFAGWNDGFDAGRKEAIVQILKVGGFCIRPDGKVQESNEDQ